jgi:hypothetical protein
LFLRHFNAIHPFSSSSIHPPTKFGSRYPRLPQRPFVMMGVVDTAPNHPPTDLISPHTASASKQQFPSSSNVHFPAEKTLSPTIFLPGNFLFPFRPLCPPGLRRLPSSSSLFFFQLKNSTSSSFFPHFAGQIHNNKHICPHPIHFPPIS